MQENNEHILKLTNNEDFKKELIEHNQVRLTIEGQSYLLQSDHRSSGNQGISLRLFLIPSLIGSLIFFIFFHYRGQEFIQLFGRISITSIILLIGIVSSFVTSSVVFVYQKRKGRKNLEDIYWRNFPTIILSITIMVAMGALFFFYLLSLLFDGLVLDIHLSTLLSLMTFSIINYLMLSFVLTISSSFMTKLLVIVILGGVLISMITNSEKQWWQNNLSFLGTQEASSAWQFNLTLMVSAFLMVALIDYLFVGLMKDFPKHRGLTVLRILLTITAVSLGLVGYFPSDGPGKMPEYHNQAAGMLVIMVMAMIVGIKWFVPHITKEFQLTSYIVGVVMFGVTYFYLNGSYITLTAFEIVAFILAFSWLMLLLQSLERSSKLPMASFVIDITD